MVLGLVGFCRVGFDWVQGLGFWVDLDFSGLEFMGFMVLGLGFRV